MKRSDSKLMAKSKALQTKQKLREFSTTKPVLQQIPKGFAASKHKRKERPTKTNPKQLRKCQWEYIMHKSKHTKWLNGYRNKTHIYVVYKRPTSDLK